MENTYATNWKNVDLTSSERHLNMLDPYDFDTLLLEISCNLRDEELTPQEIEKHALQVINEKARLAKEILRDNLQNIVNQAKKERADH